MVDVEALLEKAKKLSHIKIPLTLKNPLIRRLVVVFVVFIFLVFLLTVDFFPGFLTSVRRGAPSPRTIRAPSSARFIDEEKTQRLKEEARKATPPAYKYDVTASTRAEQNVRNFFSLVRSVKKNQELSSIEKINTLKEKTSNKISAKVLGDLLTLDNDMLGKVEEKTVEACRKTMEARFSKKSLDTRREELKDFVESFGLDEKSERIAKEIGAFYLEPNYLYDAEKTEKLKEEAAAKVKPYEIKVVKGEVIVREGDLVSSEQLKVLRYFGLVGEDTIAKKFLGALLLVSAILFAVGIYLYRYRPKVFTSARFLLLLGIILVATVFAAKIFTGFLSSYLTPVPAVGMLTTVLFDPHLAIVIVLAATVLTSASGVNVSYVLVVLLGSLFAVYVVTHILRRTTLARAGFWVSVILSYLALVAGLISGSNFSVNLVDMGWGFLGGLSSTILTIGALPFFESVFGITTEMKLLELSNPSQPLLHELMMRAPGTYNHSVVTANLAEAGAKEVGADPLLTRVASYYHDIGKIKRPYFFVENQIGKENPHDSTNPNLSYLIITAHVKEGVELAKKYRLPEEIVNIIKEHHGTSLVTYFYHRAKQEKEKEDVVETDFRYQGEKPKTKESALVMLADSVEAAARTLSKPSLPRLRQLSANIIESKLEDGQLDESNLTLTDLKKIAAAFTQVLSGIYHARIEYPSLPQAFHNKSNGNSNKQSSK